MQKMLVIILYLIFFVSKHGLAQQNNLSEDYSTYLPEIRSYYKSQPPFPKTTITSEIVKVIRMQMDKPQKTVLIPSQQTIDGVYGKIGLRIFKPEKIEAVYLDIHGGGHLWGSALSDDSLNDLLARFCNVAVLSVDYHLAPEYSFPAQIVDCNTTIKWLLQNAKANFGTDKILIGGGSAGAQLAATTMLYVRDSLQPANKVIGIGLHNGLFDLGETPSHRYATDSNPGLNKAALNEIMHFVFGNFTMEQKQSPQFSPLYANLNNLPPAFFLCGTADAFVDDTNFMESRWRSAGNKTYLALFPECAHGFYAAPLQISKVANDLYFDWIKKRIAQSK